MLRAIVLIAFCGLSSISISAQTSAFTYQGKLTDGGTPANGPYQMQFTLFPSAVGGDPISPTIPIDSVDVANGVFTVELNFTAPSAFNGGARWLAIAVKKPTDHSFSLLTPRQPITSTPYAIKSLNAVSADMATNSTQLGGVGASQYVVTTDPRMSDARTPAAGSVDYIQNNTSLQAQDSSFNISGNGTVGGTLTATNAAVTGTQPPPSSGNGTNAPNVLRVVGAKGGNTSDPNPRAFAGTGGSVLIQAGDGGDSSVPLTGAGGSITLQPGAGGFAGNVLLAPANGLVGIGTTSPQSTLHVFKSAEAPDTVGGNLIVNRFFSNAGGPGGGWRGASLFSYFPSAHNHDVLAFGVSEDTTAPNSVGAVKMVVSANGNVGIGTSNPTTNLHISAPGFARATVNSDSGNAGFGLSLNNSPKWVLATTSGEFQIINEEPQGPGQDGRALWIEPLRNWIGIGTVEPQARLDVSDHMFKVVDGSAVLINNPGASLTDTTQRLIVNGVIRARFGTGVGSPLCANNSQEIALCGSSSVRYKQNINNFPHGLDLIRRLRPVSFNWKANNQADMGLVAEEVTDVEPLLVIHNEKGEVEGVKYERVGVVLINAVKEQQAQIEKQQKLIESQQQQIDALKKLVCATNPAAAICKN